MELSIIIPTYNVEKYIKRTLESLVLQNSRDYEIIIVDDGSQDNTLGIVYDILKEQNTLNYKIIKKKNGGVSSARNRGLEVSSGKYVMFLDGDDFVSNELVENILKYSSLDDYQIICWAFDVISENDTVIQSYFNVYQNKLKHLNGLETIRSMLILKNMWLCTGSVAYKREFLLKHNFKYTENCSNGEDQEFNYKVLSKAKTVFFLDKVLSYYVQRNTSISNRYDIKRFDSVFAIKRAFEYIYSSNKHINYLTKDIVNQCILENYIYNFNSCLNSINTGRRLTNSSVDSLLNNIELNFPGLNQEIKLVMKSYKKGNWKLAIITKLFLISPALFYKIYNFRYR